MPINIGAPFQAGSTTAAGQIIAQGGLAALQRQMQMQQLAQQRDLTRMQIDASIQRQRMSADDAMERMAMQAGLQGELQEQQYQQRLGELKERATLEAEPWEYRYTTQHRRQVQQGEEAKRLLRQSGLLDPAGLAQAEIAIDLRNQGIADPSKLLKPSDAFEFPIDPETGERRNQFSTWKDEWGNVRGYRKRDGDWYEDIIVDYKDTNEYLDKQEKKEIRKEIGKYRGDLRKNNPTMDDDEINRLVQEFTENTFPEYAQEIAQAKAEQKAKPWYVQMRERGFEVADEYIAMDNQKVAQASWTLEQFKGRKPAKGTPQWGEYMAASHVIREHEAQQRAEAEAIEREALRATPFGISDPRAVLPGTIPSVAEELPAEVAPGFESAIPSVFPERRSIHEFLEGIFKATGRAGVTGAGFGHVPYAETMSGR